MISRSAKLHGVSLAAHTEELTPLTCAVVSQPFTPILVNELVKMAEEGDEQALVVYAEMFPEDITQEEY